MLVFLEHLILTAALLLLVAVVDLNEVMTVNSRPYPERLEIPTYCIFSKFPWQLNVS
jgi:hypothetical protein